MSEIKYYKVSCKCGHADSRNRCIWIEFAIMAHNGKEAAYKGRWMPRCKHHDKHAIREVTEITLEEYVAICKRNSLDPYLNSRTIQESREHYLYDRYEFDDKSEPWWKNKHSEVSRRKVYVGKEQIRNPRKYTFVAVEVLD